MKVLVAMILLTTPALAQEFTGMEQDYPLKVLPTVKVVCFKNRIEAEALASNYKGYAVYQNDTHGKIDYCTLPPTHGETVAYITEE